MREGQRKDLRYITKGVKSEAVYRRKMAKRKRIETMIYKTLHRKQEIEQHKPH
jgi:hypothetical protein